MGFFTAISSGGSGEPPNLYYPSWNGTNGYCRVNKRSAQQMPAHVGSSQCRCNAGYEPNGTATACVVPPTEEQSCKTANPVQPGTGRKRFTETDYTGAGAHALNLARHYSSRWTDGATATGLAPIAAWDGGWRHSYQASLTPRSDGSLRAYRPDGTMLGFIASATVANTWTRRRQPPTPSPPDDASGQRTGYTYTVAADDSVETYDATGKLQSIKARNGWLTTLTYSDATTPTAIAPAPACSPVSRTSSAANSSSATTPKAAWPNCCRPAPSPASPRAAPSALSVTCTTSPRAWAPACPRKANSPASSGKTATRAATTTKTARWPQAMTGITDEAGVRYGTYAYDDQGRVTRSELAGGAERLDFAYGSNAAGQSPPPPSPTTPAGSAASRSYTFTDIGNVRYPT